MNLRRRSREESLKILYKMDVIGNWNISIFREELNFRQISGVEVFYEYMEFLVDTVIDNKEFIDKKLTAKLKNWKLNRLGLIERNILRIGVAEFYFSKDVPKKVVINEAIELAKKYSTQDSAGFINGILDSIYKEQ